MYIADLMEGKIISNSHLALILKRQKTEGTNIWYSKFVDYA